MSLSKREMQCGLAAVSTAPAVVIRSGADGAVACFSGILRCGHIWTCPACSMALRAERADRIRRAIEHGGGEWRMVTLTIRHARRHELARLVAGMMKAWRRTRQGRAFQDVWGGYVTASVRALEVTWSRKNGWHPHLHVLIRSRSWDESHKAQLLDRWREFIRAELGAECEPSDARGITWSSPHDGAIWRYIAKMGLEVSGYAKETRDAGSTTPWGLAERAAKLYTREGPVLDARERARAEEALGLWVEYQKATRGRRCIELDDRAQAMALKGEDPLQGAGLRGVEFECTPVVEAPPVVLELTPWQLSTMTAGERVSPGFTWHLLRALEVAEHPREMLHAWCSNAFSRYFWKRKAWRARDASASALALQHEVENDGAREELQCSDVPEETEQAARAG